MAATILARTEHLGLRHLTNDESHRYQWNDVLPKAAARVRPHAQLPAPKA